MSTAMMRAPALAMAWAMPSPIPEPAPVTRAIRFASNPSIVRSLRPIERDRELGNVSPRRFHRECLAAALRCHVQQRREGLAGRAYVELIARRLSGNTSADAAGSFEPIA